MSKYPILSTIILITFSAIVIYFVTTTIQNDTASDYSGGYNKSYRDDALIDKTIDKIRYTNSESKINDSEYNKNVNVGTIYIHTTDSTSIRFNCNNFDINIAYCSKINQYTYKVIKVINITDFTHCTAIKYEISDMYIRIINNPSEQSKKIQKSFNL